MKAYIPLAEPVLNNGSEALIIRQQDKRCLTTAEVNSFRKTAGSSLWDHKGNELVT
jgi:hypothetical protein